MAITLTKQPAAVLTDLDILTEAAEALAEAERLRLALRDSDNRLRALCRQYEAATGYRMLTPTHLGHMCRARGLMP